MAQSAKQEAGHKLPRNSSSEPAQEINHLRPGTPVLEVLRIPKVMGAFAAGLFTLLGYLYTQAFNTASPTGFDLISLAFALFFTISLLIAVLWVNLFQLPHNLLDFNESLARARSEIEATTEATQEKHHSKQAQIIDNLEAQLRRACAHAQDLQARMSPHLITWDESSHVEMKAAEVLCISATLDWACWSINEIIDDCVQKPTKQFSYLVHSDGDSSHATTLANNIRKILAEIHSRSANDADLQRLHNQIQIQLCPRDDAPGETKNPLAKKLRLSSTDDLPRAQTLIDYLKCLPLGGDYVIYKGVVDESGDQPCERTFAVVSATWPDGKQAQAAASGSGEKNVDLRLKDIRQYGPVLNWFSLEWDRYVPSKKAGEE